MNSAVRVSILLALFFAAFHAVPIPSRSAHYPHRRISRIASIHAQHRAFLMRAAEVAPAAALQPPADIATQQAPNDKRAESEDQTPDSKHEKVADAPAKEQTSPSVSRPTPSAQTDKPQADTTSATQAASSPSAVSLNPQSPGSDTNAASDNANQSEAAKGQAPPESAVSPSAEQRLKTSLDPSVSTVAIIGAAITVLVGVYVVWSKSSRSATQANQPDDHTYRRVETDPRADGASAPIDVEADGWNAGWEDDEDWEPTAPTNKV